MKDSRTAWAQEFDEKRKAWNEIDSLKKRIVELEQSSNKIKAEAVNDFKNEMLYEVANKYDGNDLTEWSIGANHVFKLFARYCLCQRDIKRRCGMKTLSEKLKQWRCERPDEWKMDEFIRYAEELEQECELLVHENADKDRRIADLREIQRLRAENETLRNLCKQCADYLDINDLTNIAHGSIYHKELRKVDKEQSE